ncbi:MAG: tetratricopeptide repeat protein [Armatimonadetes bacterium]|nr:tetratricopeptide repeat protein [Armatimonadota bacterium]
METSEYKTRGLKAYKAGDYAAAVAELEQATLENPQDFEAFLYLGAAYAGVARHNAAIGAFKRAEELRPNDARIHYNLGQAYEAAGVPKEAFFEYSYALRLNPYHTLARMAQTSLKMRMGRQHSSRFVA